jgi:hypothetical protein
VKLSMSCCCAEPITKAWMARKAWATPISNDPQDVQHDLPWVQRYYAGGGGNLNFDWGIWLDELNTTPGDIYLAQGMRYLPFAPEQGQEWWGGTNNTAFGHNGYPVQMTEQNLRVSSNYDYAALPQFNTSRPASSLTDSTGPGGVAPIVGTHPAGSLSRSIVDKLAIPAFQTGYLLMRLKHWRLVVNGSPGPLRTRNYLDEDGEDIGFGSRLQLSKQLFPNVSGDRLTFAPGNTYGIDVWFELTRYSVNTSRFTVRGNTFTRGNVQTSGFVTSPGCGTFGLLVGANRGLKPLRHGYTLTFSGENQFPENKEVVLEPADTDSSKNYSYKDVNPYGNHWTGEAFWLKWAREIPVLSVDEKSGNAYSSSNPRWQHYIPPNNAGHPTDWHKVGVPAGISTHPPTTYHTNIINPGGQWDCRSPLTFVRYFEPTSDHYFPPDLRYGSPYWDAGVTIERYSIVDEEE